MIYFERVSSIGIPQQQHPFLEASRYSLAKEPYLKKEVILTALAIVAITATVLAVFPALGCSLIVPLAVLGAVALIASVATLGSSKDRRFYDLSRDDLLTVEKERVVTPTFLKTLYQRAIGMSDRGETEKLETEEVSKAPLDVAAWWSNGS